MGEVEESKKSRNSAEDSDGFIKVQSKFRYSTSNNKKKKKKNHQNMYKFVDSSTWTVSDMVKHLDIYKYSG